MGVSMQDTHILTMQFAVDLTQVLGQENIKGAMFVLGCKSEEEVIQHYVDNLAMRVENAMGFRPDCRVLGVRFDQANQENEEPVDQESIMDSEWGEELDDEKVEHHPSEESLSYQSNAGREPEVAQAISDVLHSDNEEPIDFNKAPFSMVDVTEKDPYPEMDEEIEMDFLQNLSSSLEEGAMLGKVKEIQILRSLEVPKELVQQMLEGEKFADATITYTHSFEENQEDGDPITFRLIIGGEDGLSDTTMVGYGQY